MEFEMSCRPLKQTQTVNLFSTLINAGHWTVTMDESPHQKTKHIEP